MTCMLPGDGKSLTGSDVLTGFTSVTGRGTDNQIRTYTVSQKNGTATINMT